MVSKREKTGSNNDAVNMERTARIPRASPNTMYRWSMWRMYLNEEFSQVITRATGNETIAHASSKSDDKYSSKSGKNAHKKDNKTTTVSSVAAEYLRHPDAMMYGCMMKDTSARRHRRETMERTLPGNLFLVYGLPRVSLAKHLPTGVRELYASAEKLERQERDALDTDKCINTLFDFVTDEIKEEHVTSLKTQNTESPSTELIPTTTNGISSHTDAEFYNTDSVLTTVSSRDKTDIDRYRTPAPVISKSRLFWEKLANSKSKIIEAEANGNPAPQNEAISSDVLLRQHKMLKKTKPKARSSRDLWRTVRERKSEIILLQDTDRDPELHQILNVKKQQSKPNQLWSFIFSKKMELLKMKRNKGEHVQQNTGLVGQKHKRSDEHLKKEKDMPQNFQDNFQKELQTRLIKMRERAQQDT